MRKPLRLLFSLSPLIACHAAFAVTNLGDVVCLGDSITEGKNYGGGGYRQFLQNDLTTLNYTYNFVGKEDNGQPANFTNYSNGMIDPNHEGYGSFTISNLIYGGNQEGHASPPIATLLANDANPVNGGTGPVNLVLLMIGTNNMGLNGSSYDSNAAAELNTLVGDILNSVPGISLIVASIPAPASPTVVTRVQSYNATIPNMVATDEAMGENIRYADVYSALNPSEIDPSDGIHPLPSGYQQIAKVWAEAIGQTSVNVSNSSIVIPASTNWAAGTLFVNNGGTATFQGDSGATSENLSITVPAGSVLFQSTQHLAALTIGFQNQVQLAATTTGNRSILFTPSLIVNGTLDLTDNDLDVQAGDLPTVTALIKSGLTSNSSTGDIISSTAAADSNHLTTLGAILNNNGGAALYGSGQPLGLFDGANPASTDVLVKYTYYGDANLDGKVDGSDYSRIDSGYLTHATGWYNGDFNYDGTVDGSDYTLIDNAFNRQSSVLDSQVSAQITAQIASVPEPILLPVLGAAYCGLLRRRSKGGLIFQ